jgi:5'-nucleotidase / UDP-sugar diphosphatase
MTTRSGVIRETDGKKAGAGRDKPRSYCDVAVSMPARSLKPLCVLQLLALAFVISCASVPPQDTRPVATGVEPLAQDRIQILHTGDIHGHLDEETVSSGATTSSQGGMATLAGLVARYRARAPQRTLLLDAGDAWQGTFISNANQGQAVVQAMSLMRYDAQVLGNHDFDWGQDVLARRARESSFPFLAANVVDASGATPAFAKPYVVKDLGVARVAILGLSRVDTPSVTKAANTVGLRFLPLADTVQRYLGELRRAADIVVVVDHNGAQADVRLAEAVPDIDVIVGGHDHVPLRTAVLVGKTTIVDPGPYTQNLGHLELVIDPATKKVVAANRSDELTAVAAGRIQPDPQVAALVAERRSEGERYTSRIVGRTAERLAVSRDESPVGNLVADALLEYGRQQGWMSDVAFYNTAGLRADLPPGDVTYGKLYEVLPFGDVVVGLHLTGEQLRAVFEKVAAGAGRVAIANAAFVYHYGGPSDHQLLEATVGGDAIEPARVYHVVTTDYLLGGGDGHDELKLATNLVFGDLEVDVVAGYMTKHSPVDPKVEGRVISR